MDPVQTPQDQTPPATQPPQYSIEHDKDIQRLIPTKNKPALFAYYFGVFGFIPGIGLPLSVAAIILGWLGLKQYAANPTPGAKGHALAGVIMGVIQLVIFACFIGLLIYTHSNEPY